MTRRRQTQVPGNLEPQPVTKPPVDSAAVEAWSQSLSPQQHDALTRLYEQALEFSYAKEKEAGQ